MSGGLARKEAAELLGVGAATLLYYERRGLISPTRDPANGYRLYAEADIARLGLVLKAKGLGLTLGEISELLAGIESGAAVEALRAGAAAKVAAIRRQIGELERRARDLEGLASSEGFGSCETMRAVAEAGAGEGRRKSSDRA
jgi:DNA-binding transcriptional MerR regulator